MILRNVKIFRETDRFIFGSIRLTEERIIEISDQVDLHPKENEVVLDGRGGYLIPGLIDIHLHGSKNIDFCNATGEEIEKIAQFQLSEGVTAFLGATMAIPKENLMEVCRRVGAYGNRFGAELIGINMESPFISTVKRGAQNSEYLIPPDLNFFYQLQDAAQGKIKILGVAPELPGAEKLIEAASQGVRLSIAHSNADYETAKGAFRSGFSHATHLFNAMSPFHHRNPGIVGAAFEEKSCMVEMIADGNFIHPCMMNAAMRLFEDDRIILISDGMPATGMPDGQYDLAGDAILVKDKVGFMQSDGAMAGPAISLMGCLKATLNKTEFTLEQAVKCATKNPAKAVGIFEEQGSLSVGKLANLVLLDEDLSIQQIIYKGKLLKRSKGE